MNNAPSTSRVASQILAYEKALRIMAARPVNKECPEPVAGILNFWIAGSQGTRSRRIRVCFLGEYGRASLRIWTNSRRVYSTQTRLGPIQNPKSKIQDLKSIGVEVAFSWIDLAVEIG